MLVVLALLGRVDLAYLHTYTEGMQLNLVKARLAGELILSSLVIGMVTWAAASEPKVAKQIPRRVAVPSMEILVLDSKDVVIQHVFASHAQVGSWLVTASYAYQVDAGAMGKTGMNLTAERPMGLHDWETKEYGWGFDKTDVSLGRVAHLDGYTVIATTGWRPVPGVY